MVRKPNMRGKSLNSSPEPIPETRALKGHKSVNKRKGDENDGSESDRPIPKKAKRSAPQEENGIRISTTGESFVDLGKQKRASVSKFKNNTYVNIREYYGPAGDEKPGKKGIALTKEQWDALKSNIGIIDRLLAEVTE